MHTSMLEMPFLELEGSSDVCVVARCTNRSKKAESTGDAAADEVSLASELDLSSGSGAVSA